MEHDKEWRPNCGWYAEASGQASPDEFNQYLLRQVDRIGPVSHGS